MPRKARMYLPGIPAHIVQRGNNRGACFYCAQDYQFYLERLAEGLRRYRVALHAYVLMANHVHLLMTPVDTGGISRLMQHLGRHYVLYVNREYRRTGTLWEGRHKASLVQADGYLLTCMRYIELNPVAAGMVATPDQYKWSSYRHHAWGEPNALIEDHAIFTELGDNLAERRQAYRELVQYQISDADLHTLRNCLSFNFPFGDNRFRQQIEQALGRRLGEPRRGRPASRPASASN